MEILRKSISALLALVMVVTMLPISALAEETAGDNALIVPETTAETEPVETLETVPAETETVETVPEIVIEETVEAVSGPVHSIDFKDKENNNSISAANELIYYNKNWYSGELTGWDSDYFKFNTTNYGSGTVDISIVVGAVYSTFSVTLYDASGKSVYFNTGGDAAPEGGYEIAFTHTTSSGTYYLQIRAGGVTKVDNSYTFKISVKEGSYGCSHYSTSSLVTKPTCGTQGYTTYTCKNCGKVWQMDYTDPTGKHTYTDDNDMTCNVCGETREGKLCGENVVWQISNKTLTISGTGAMYDYSVENDSLPPWYYKIGTGVEKIVIQDGVTRIGNDAFRGNGFSEKIKAVTIANSVTSIGDNAFRDRGKLTSVTIPDSVTKMGNRIFYDCTALTSVDLPEKITNLGTHTFYNCAALTDVTLPKGITVIGKSTFYGCTALTSVTIPESVTSIGDYAFGSCEALTTVAVPKSVTKIGGYLFQNCKSLKSVTLPEGIKSIGISTFYGCEALTSIEIPKSVTGIWDNAFQECKALTSIVIPKGVTSIGNEVFKGCTSLTSATLPDSVTEIGHSLFYDCTALASVVMPKKLTKLGSHTFYHCAALTDVTLPQGLTKIGKSTFCGCKILPSVSIPESVTSIGDYAFQDCEMLPSITLPEGVTSIGKYAFDGCKALTSITIPQNVTEINSNAFTDCCGLKTITFLGAPPWIFGEPFCNVTANVYYPANIEGWANFAKDNYGGTLTWIPDKGSCTHPEQEVIVAVAPTCTEPGLTEGKRCVECGEILETPQEIPALGHSYQSVVTSPTCTEDGYTTYTCICGDSYIGDYVAAGHTPSSWKSDAAQHWLECTGCGEKLDAGNHEGNPCGICGYAVEESHGYDLGDVNHDNKINAKDATLILQKSVGVLKESAKFCETCAEVSGDGKLNAKDSTLILQFSVGLRDHFPAQEK